MALQSLNLGTAANDGTGDNLRVGGDKINDNFAEIYSAFGNGSTLSSLAVTALNGATANEIVTVGSTTTELDAESGLTFDGSTLAVTGNITATTITLSNDAGLIVPDAGNIGSASATDAMQISSGGIVTFKDDILLKNDGTIGSAGTAAAMTIDSDGIVAFGDDIKIKDGGTIGTATDADAITIAAAGAVTFSQRDVHSSGITVADDGQIGSASDADAIAISAAGITTFSQKDVHSVGLSVKNGSTSAGFIEFFENSGNGTNKVTLIGPASTGDVTLTLGSAAGTVATTADIAGEATALAIALG